MTAIVSLLRHGSIMLRLIGERSQAIAQRMEPGDLGCVGAPHGAQIALLRFEAQANNIHVIPPPPAVRRRAIEAKKG